MRKTSFALALIVALLMQSLQLPQIVHGADDVNATENADNAQTTDTEPTVVFEDDFEDDTIMFETTSSNKVIDSGERELGKVFRGLITRRSAVFSPTYILKNAADSPEIEGANCFVETEFDFKSEEMSVLPQGLCELKLTSDYVALNTKAFFTITYNVGNGNITYKNGNNTVVLDEIKDEWNNFRIVIQATDAENNPVSKIVQFYFNGEPQLDAPINFTQTDTASLNGYNQFLIASSGFGDYNPRVTWQFDNFKVTKYNRAEGEILRVNKVGLLSAIRKADSALKDANRPAAGLYYPEEMVQNLTQSRDDALAVYLSTESTQTAISEKCTALLTLLEGFAPQELKIPFEYIIENDFDEKTGAPFEFSSYEKIDAPYVGNAAVLYGTSYGFSYTASGFTPTYLLDSSDETRDAFTVEGGSCDVTTQMDVMFSGLVENGVDYQIELANKDSSDKTPVLRVKFIGNGAKIAVQRGASFTDISAENVIEDNVWYNLKIVMHATNETAAVKKIDIYLNNTLIAEDLNFQTTTVGKADKYDQIKLSGVVSSKAAVYLDGFKVYKTTPYTLDIPTDYDYPIYVLRRCFSFFEKAVAGDGATDYDELEYNSLKEKYDAVTLMLENGEERAATDAAASELLSELTSIRPNGEPLIVTSVTASTENITSVNESVVSIGIKTGKKADASNNITAVVMLCEKSSTVDGGIIKRIFTNEKVIPKDSEDVITIPVSLEGFTEEEKGNMYITSVVFKGDTKLLTVEVEEKHLFGLPSETAVDFDKTDEKLVYSRVTYEEDGEKESKALLVYKTQPGELVGITVAKIGKTVADIISDSSNIEYALTKRADSEGYVCFEIVPSGGNGKYEYAISGAEYSEGSFYYSKYSDVDAIYQTLKTASAQTAETTILNNAELIGIENDIITKAIANEIKVGSISVSLFKYSSYSDADEFFSTLNSSIDAINTIHTAKNSDEVGLMLESDPQIAGDCSDYINASNKVKKEANGGIYDKKAEVYDIESFIVILKEAVKEAKEGSDDSVGDSGSNSNISVESGSGDRGGSGGSGGVSAGIGSGGSSKPVQTPMESVDLKFDDIDDVTWAREAIYVLALNGCISGKSETKFAPHDNITREEFLKIALLALKMNNNKTEIPFKDVEPDAWYAEYVAAAYGLGVANGITADTFGIGRPITRQDAATLVFRIAQLKNEGFADGGVYIRFDDENVIADYALDAVKALAGQNIINGMENNLFVPGAYCTRAQAAKILYGVYKLIG